MTEATLPSVIQRMEARARAETTPSEQAHVWMSTYILMGLRYPESLTKELLRGVRAMEESVTYQGLIRQGKETEAHRFLLIMGKERFGAPDSATEAALMAITDLEQLEALGTRLLRVDSWEELLAAPKPPRRKPRGKS